MGKKTKEKNNLFMESEKQKIGVIVTPKKKKTLKLFWGWLYYLLRAFRSCFHNRKLRKLKLGTVCFKKGQLKTIDISWDIHLLSSIYLAAIIRDYLRFFIQNTPAPGNYVYEHNPEGLDYADALEKLDSDVMFERWEKVVNDVADKFDAIVQADTSEIEYEKYRAMIVDAFDDLKEIFYDLVW